jgi:Kef-type K+ transport system membrane component KefB
MTGPASLIGITIVMVLAVAVLGEVVGIHAVFGAFLVGVALGGNLDSERVKQTHDTVYQFAISFFAPLYFVFIGLNTDFVSFFNFPLIVLVLTIAFAGKVIGAGMGAWLGGMKPRAALAVGFGMNARGAMEVILASVAFETGVINQEALVAFILMALITSLISAPVLQRLARG